MLRADNLTTFMCQFDIHGSVHHRWLSRNTNKMQLCNIIYYYKVYWRLNMFGATHHSSSGALNCIYSLWFIYTFGDRSLPRLSLGNCRSKHVEPSVNFGIINSITKLHLVGISTDSCANCLETWKPHLLQISGPVQTCEGISLPSARN